MEQVSRLAAPILGLLFATTTGVADEQHASVTGELKQWHKVTLTLTGPEASEAGDPNPFLDYRLQVTFEHPASGATYEVPGYFAADGDAGNTSATAGDKWRAHLAPDQKGEWTYRVSFRKGSKVAISDDAEAGAPIGGLDGLTGSFVIAESDKTGRDFRAKGRLDYVDKHHLRFAGSGEYFLKAGADAPENFLAYREFDGDFKTDRHKDKLVKDWAPHVQDWRPGDPTWQGDKGKGILGVVNYLADQGMNVFSFITLNIDGDDRNVFPYTSYDVRNRIDCSRMDQWETVFSHGTNRGMYLHFKTQEAENVNLLDNGELGPQRKLYYRELIARFAHNLALNWNLGEEVGLGHKVSTEKKKAWGEYFETHDPYHHHIVIHNGNQHYDLLGPDSALTGFSLQTNSPDFRNVHNRTRDYLRRSVEAGKAWVVACDEPGDASHSLITDAEDPDHNDARINALWGNLMAGGAGVEWYFGYKHPHSDLTCQDQRARENMWLQSKIALDFFADNKIPFWDMHNANRLLSTKRGYCLTKPGEVYLAFLKQGESATLDLSDAKGVFEIHWFNPRTGGELVLGSNQSAQAGGEVFLGIPPIDPGRDWLAVLRPGNPSKDYPPNLTTKIDKDRSTLLAVEDFEAVKAEGFVPPYKDGARNALAINAGRYRDRFAAAETTYEGEAGDFDLVLTTLTETDGESTYRLIVAGEGLGEVRNPESQQDYKPIQHRFRGVRLQPGDTVRVEFNSASNGKIPEGDAFAFARGRWRSVSIFRPAESKNELAENPTN